MRAWRKAARPQVTPSPNIWHWPELFEIENRAQDATGALWDALRERCDWADRDVVDIGCGDGFHLPLFAAEARTVIGIEPHQPLVERARRRMAGTPGVDVRQAPAQQLPLADASADLVHARTAYFFGPGCEPGLAEAERVLRPGGVIAIVDLDAGRSPYGDWMRADAPQIDPAAIEEFFQRHDFDSTSVATEWRFDDREALEAVLGIEFSAKVAARAAREVPGCTLPVGYRLRTRRKPTTLLTP
ncbi:Methyltransferase domain-containing protein [Saccharopolyspora kobensis]|uniref:Methyltransferase domain-containing protein n=1 Tax=Saccharopolyspora kobensis TaxID=146035 RepID=A0A1H6BSH4_9PSEU|nr:class I SAM-dependent methyltransferase [Saccharopolyspora kobensis]SEG63377.1 Methyltransferase domain-containing protein [Saccharopolyspora kobensis]SFC13557.1 Methyltransferase domain-containing protein [Saccharopolyspora kobensis]